MTASEASKTVPRTTQAAMHVSSLVHCILLFSSNLPTSVSAQSSSGSSDCTFFAINGSSFAESTHFTHYRFYDFRNIIDPLPPPVGQSSGLTASHTTNDSSWLLDWGPRNQAQGAANRVSIPVNYLPSNVYVSPANEPSSDYSSYLTLATSKLGNDTQSAAEIGFLPATDIVYVSLRVLARVSGTPGAVGGIFSYCDDESETDIEILTHDPTSQVRYSNQPTTNSKTGVPIAGATANDSIPSSNWEQWNVHRLDWLPGQTAKWANGVRLQTSTVNVQNTTARSQVFLDMWSNGGTWSGPMAVGGSAVMEVQWIEMAYNISGGSAPEHGATVCDIDKVVGSPVPAVSGGAQNGLYWNIWTWLCLVILSTTWLA